jgi:hypothetical protein
MGGNQGEPANSGQRPVGPHRQDREARDPDEHMGPVAIARHVKADGRALILYTVDRRPRT